MSWIAEKISTRLIESMPRSASSRISSSSMSTGYPVFSATASNNARARKSVRSGARFKVLRGRLWTEAVGLLSLTDVIENRA